MQGRSCSIKNPHNREEVGFGANEGNPSLLVWDDKRMKMCGKALGVSWWMQSLGKSRGQNPLGLWPLRFCPWHFPRDSIRHGIPLAFPHIVPGVWSVNNRATNQRLWQNISILLSPLVKVNKFYLDKSKQKEIFLLNGFPKSFPHSVILCKNIFKTLSLLHCKC